MAALVVAPCCHNCGFGFAIPQAVALPLLVHFKLPSIYTSLTLNYPNRKCIEWQLQLSLGSQTFVTFKDELSS